MAKNIILVKYGHNKPEVEKTISVINKTYLPVTGELLDGTTVCISKEASDADAIYVKEYIEKLGGTVILEEAPKTVRLPDTQTAIPENTPAITNLPRPWLPVSSGSPMIVDGSENVLSILLPSREHSSYAPALKLVKAHGFILEPADRKWWLRDSHKVHSFLQACETLLRESFDAQFTLNVSLSNPGDREASAAASPTAPVEYSGKTYNRLHVYCFCKWDKQSSDTDYIDLIDASMNVWILENIDNGSLFAYSMRAHQIFCADEGSRAELLDMSFPGDGSIPSVLLSGLAQSADDGDEDGVYEYINANGGKLEFANGSDNPKDISVAGVACCYSSARAKKIVVTEIGHIPRIRIDNTDDALLSDSTGFLDDDESRVAVYFH